MSGGKIDTSIQHCSQDSSLSIYDSSECDKEPTISAHKLKKSAYKKDQTGGMKVKCRYCFEE